MPCMCALILMILVLAQKNHNYILTLHSDFSAEDQQDGVASSASSNPDDDQVLCMHGTQEIGQSQPRAIKIPTNYP